jgi:hypothetical protein
LLVDREVAQALVDTMGDAEGKADLQARLDTIVIEQLSLVIYYNSSFVLNEPNLVLVGFDANSYEGKEVTVLFTHSEGITLEYKLNEADEWIPITDYFGSPTGFPLSSHAYLFRVTCTVAGANTVGIEVRDISGTLMVSKELTVTL